MKALAARIIARNHEGPAARVPLFHPLESGTAEQSPENGRNLRKTSVPPPGTKPPVWNSLEQPLADPSADWAERAAIIEHVGGYSRADADRHAREGWNSGDWRRWHGELVSRRITRGDPPEEAESFAYGTTIWEWHARGGTIPAPGTCAGCGEPVAGPLRAWPDGASIHGTACSIRWAEHWHRKAAEGLLALGVEAPKGWAP